MKLSDHPTVKQVRAQIVEPAESPPLAAQMLKQLVLDAGADDVGFVAIDRPGL